MSQPDALKDLAAHLAAETAARQAAVSRAEAAERKLAEYMAPVAGTDPRVINALRDIDACDIPDGHDLFVLARDYRQMRADRDAALKRMAEAQSLSQLTMTLCGVPTVQLGDAPKEGECR